MRTVATNFDHTIDLDVVMELRANPGTEASFTAWDFIGEVSFLDPCWQCEVWQCHRLVETVHAPDINTLIKNVRDKYGWD